VIEEFEKDIFDASTTNKMYFRLSVVNADYEMYGAIATTTPIG
jgi:hypothetical protein